MKIIIVDENDEQISAKERNIVTSEDIYRVSALWITNSDGEVLLAQRKWSKKNNPGMWGPAVAGTIEVGETYESNIYKEAEEEIGLTGVEVEAWFKKLYEGEHAHFTQWYRAALNWPIDKFQIQEEEVEAIRWISIPELKADIEQNPSKYLRSVIENVGAGL